MSEEIAEIDFKKSRLTWADQIQVGDLTMPVDQIVARLEPHMTAERLARLQQVVSKRSLHMVSVLENIYDRGNVSAVMRSSEAFGFLQMSLIDRPDARFKAANRITRGAEKWLDVKSYNQPALAVHDLKKAGYQVWATDLATDETIDTIDWSKPTAIVLGNEKDGITPEMAKLVDGRFRIPMQGFSQSFNISVAAALIFYRAHIEMRKLGDAILLNEKQRLQVLANYYLRCFDNPEGILQHSKVL